MDPMATVEHTARVAELRAGTEVEGVFACTRKDRLTAKSGTPYLAVELRDRTGAIQARAFRGADFLAGQFERGDLVSVRGRVERFREELQIDLHAIRRAEGADPAAFLPTAYRDLDELDGEVGSAVLGRQPVLAGASEHALDLGPGPQLGHARGVLQRCHRFHRDGEGGRRRLPWMRCRTASGAAVPSCAGP